MAVAVVLEFPGGTLEQYDEVIGKMGFTKGGPGGRADCFTGSEPEMTGL
jgi:hypothetical protein